MLTLSIGKKRKYVEINKIPLKKLRINTTCEEKSSFFSRLILVTVWIKVNSPTVKTIRITPRFNSIIFKVPLVTANIKPKKRITQKIIWSLFIRSFNRKYPKIKANIISDFEASALLSVPANE